MKVPLKPHLKALQRVRIGETSRAGFLRLDLNEGPGLPEAFVREALAGVDPEFLSCYPEYHRLKGLLARHAGIKPENISLATGSDGAIKNIFEAFVGRGDRVLFTDPTFAMYPVYCRMFQARPLKVPYGKDLSFPLEDFAAALRPGLRLAVLVNPNNPTGTAVEPARILELVRRARRHGTLFLVDEAYFYFCPKTMMPWVRRCDNLIVLRTFSKLCGLAAGRLGYAAAHPEVVDGLRRVKSVFDVNALAAHLAERLLERPALLRRLTEDAAQGKRWLLSRLRAEGIPHVAGEANFVLIRSGRSLEPWLVRGLAERKVLVSGGFSHEGLRDCVRVTTGHRAAMERFWSAFLPVWRALAR
ncbi:MAG: histidinol-phosphate aminotransferase family protein [Elusimicrobia bacterium]|nr:histidinol-phosphate aminotransferase family protein [Elusimicrobiota bacterium]